MNDNDTRVLTVPAPPQVGAGFDEHQGSSVMMPVEDDDEVKAGSPPSQKLGKSNSQVSLVHNKTMTISRPILRDHSPSQALFKLKKQG